MATIIKIVDGHEEVLDNSLGPWAAFQTARELNDAYAGRGVEFRVEYGPDENPPHRPPQAETYDQVPLKAPKALIRRVRLAAAQRRIPMAQVWQEGAEIWLKENGTDGS